MKKLKEIEKLDLVKNANVETLHHAEEDNFSFLQEDDLGEILGGYYCGKGFRYNGDVTRCRCDFYS